MRLTCPTCAAAYEVPDRLLAGGARRPVRCTRCGTVWVPATAPEAERPEAAEAGAAPPAPAAPPEGREPEGTTPETGVPEGRPQASPAEAPPEPSFPPPPRTPVEAPPWPLPTPPARPPLRIEPPLVAPEERRGGQVALALAWLVSLALVVGGLAALWIWRAEVSTLWPPAARLFAWLGGV